MYQDSKFNIRIDFEKSHDSYIYDKNRKKYFLDFFGPYSTLTLGYNHKIFKRKSFQEAINRLAGTKVVNCETISDEAEDFFQKFSGHKDMRKFKHFHFCCTGGIAVEAAIKAAIDQKGTEKPIIISLKESFHGITGYGGMATDKFNPVKKNLEDFPVLDWPKIHNPKIIYKNNLPDVRITQRGLERFKKEFDQCIKKYKTNNIAGLLIEPIQSTYGDNYFPRSFFRIARILCNKYKIPLIFDEVQTGFGATGKMWYFQYLGIEPDIVVFGKKAYISGIMVKEKFGKIFKTPTRLEITWDGNLIDMVCSRYVLEAYDKYNILENVRKRGKELVKGLKKIDSLKNVRGQGLLVAFDFKTSKEQDSFIHKAFDNGLIFNKTRDKTIRLRPPLTLSSVETQEAIKIIKASV